MSTRATGVVTKWVSDKGFGFIHGDDGVEYFFHRSAVRQGPDAVEIQYACTFRTSTSTKGPRAEDVDLLGPKG